MEYIMNLLLAFALGSSVFTPQALAAPPRVKSAMEIVDQTIALQHLDAPESYAALAEFESLLADGPIKVSDSEYEGVLLGLYLAELNLLDSVVQAGVATSERLGRPVPFTEMNLTFFIAEVPPADELAWRYADVVAPHTPELLGLEDLLYEPLWKSEVAPPASYFYSCKKCSYRCQTPVAGPRVGYCASGSCSGGRLYTYMANASTAITGCC